MNAPKTIIVRFEGTTPIVESAGGEKLFRNSPARLLLFALATLYEQAGLGPIPVEVLVNWGVWGTPNGVYNLARKMTVDGERVFVSGQGDALLRFNLAVEWQADIAPNVESWLIEEACAHARRSHTDLKRIVRDALPTVEASRVRSVSREHVMRSFRYRPLFQQYPELEEACIRSPGGQPIPFRALVEPDGVSVLDLSVEDSGSRYDGPQIGLVLDAYDSVADIGNIRSDDWKVRVDAVDSHEGRPRLMVSPVKYSWYDVTNRAFAGNRIDGYFPGLEQWQVQRMLAPTVAELELSTSASCSNHLGVTALVVTSDGLVFFPHASQQVNSSPGERVPSVSGSADWPLDSEDGTPADAASLSIVHELLREYVEETIPRMEPRPHRRQLIRNLRNHDAINLALGHFSTPGEHGTCELRLDPARAPLLAIAQNMERGGKPEVFALLFSTRPRSYYAAAASGLNDFEHTSKGTELDVRFPMLDPTTPAPDWEDAYRVLTSLADDTERNAVERASIVFALRYVDAAIRNA